MMMIRMPFTQGSPAGGRRGIESGLGPTLPRIHSSAHPPFRSFPGGATHVSQEFAIRSPRAHARRRQPQAELGDGGGVPGISMFWAPRRALPRAHRPPGRLCLKREKEKEEEGPTSDRGL